MKWVARKNANVDRVACPWLIKRFVDGDAEFLYVPAEDVMATAESEQATPYDVKEVELGHVDGRCSFESIMLKYNLTDPALQLLAKVVHGADVSADRDIVPKQPASTRSRTALRSYTARTTTRKSAWRSPCTTPSTLGARTKSLGARRG
jgi:hypothetical protein